MGATVTRERIEQEEARAKAWYENAPSLADRKEFRAGYNPGFENSSERVPDTIDSFEPDEETRRLCEAIVFGES